MNAKINLVLDNELGVWNHKAIIYTRARFHNYLSSYLFSRYLLTCLILSVLLDKDPFARKCALFVFCLLYIRLYTSVFFKLIWHVQSYSTHFCYYLLCYFCCFFHLFLFFFSNFFLLIFLLTHTVPQFPFVITQLTYVYFINMQWRAKTCEYLGTTIWKLLDWMPSLPHL